MEMSETATSDRAAWDAIGSGEDPEVSDDSPQDESPSSEESAEASPATADTDADAGSEESADVTDEAQPDGPTSPDAKAPGSTDQPAPQTPVQPFVAHVDGKELRIPGAVRTNGYIAIPEKSWEHVQRNLADRNVWREKERGYQQEIAAKGEKEVQASVLIEHFAGLLENRDKLIAWLENFEANRVVLQKDMELAGAKAKLEGREKQDSQANQEQWQRDYEEWKPKILRQTVTGFLSRPEFKDAGLKAETIVRKLELLGNALFLEATEDMPAWGVTKGQWTPNLHTIARLIQEDAEDRREALKARTQTEQAKRTNAAATGKVAPKAPPAVSAKGSPTPGGKKSEKPSSYEEWVASLD